MKPFAAVLALSALLGIAPPAHAQSAIDHDVQRAWDNLFDPPPPGDPRTNWERRRDQARYVERRDAEHAAWCRAHPGVRGCGEW